MIIYLLGAFMASLVCGLIFTPLILDFCKRKKLYDIPNERKVHKNLTPRLGGISFFPSMMLAFAAILFYFTLSHRYSIPMNTWSASFVFGLAIIYLTGIIDDLIGLKAGTKFVVQILTACLFPIAGLYINNLYGLFGIGEIPYYIGVPLTVFIVVFIENAINLIDGIDGLASSLSFIALTGFLAYFSYYHVFVYTYSIIAAGMMGALTAYMYFNMFGRPERNTKIFMGDSGSLSLGFTLGFFAVKCAMNNEQIWSERAEAILVPTTLLFVPVADVVRVIFFRLRHGLHLFSADKNHIHHKLMRTGLTQHQTLAVILLLALSVIIFNGILYWMVPQTLIVIFDIALYTCVHIAINKKTKAAA